MGKNINNEENKMENIKAAKNQARKELAKTIIITILVTGLIAFIGGVKYQEGNTNAITSQVKELSIVKQ